MPLNLLAVVVPLSACVPARVPASVTTSSQSLLLVSSTPAAGSTVRGPVEELLFRFSTPVRLMEVIVAGPKEAMPVMITPAGETEAYSIPVSDLETGSYSVSWRATSAGREFAGSFSFRVT